MVLGVQPLPDKALPFRRAALGAALALSLSLLAAQSARAAGASVSPPPGAVLTASPVAVSVRLPGAPAAGARLEVLNENQADVGNGPPQTAGDTLRLALNSLAPGVYTVTWAAGAATGSSSFTVWNGGQLPPPLLRAAYGGPYPGPASRAAGVLLLLTLVAGLVGVGALALPARPATLPLPGQRVRNPQAGPLRLAGLAMAAAGVAAALLHTAAVLGIPPGSLSASPLAPPLLARGVALDGFLAAGCGLLALLLGGMPRAAAALLVLGLLPGLLAIPALQGAGAGTFAAACGLALGLGLYAGAWPHVLRRRGRQSPLPRLLGLALALAAGVPLLLRWQPLRGPLAIGAAAAAGLALLLGRPGARRSALSLAEVLGLAAALVLTPALGASSARAGTEVLPRHPVWGYSAAGSGGTAHLAVAPFRVGVNLIEVRAAGASGQSLPLTLTDPAVPGLTRRLALPRVGPGLYALSTAALSEPGAWTASAAGATFQLSLAGAAGQGCTASFTGFTAAVATLDGGVTALATDPGDGRQAIAATPHGVYATGDGGRTWLPAGDPGPVRALAIGLYGEWFAATPSGVLVSQDGGAHWTPAPGVSGSATALAELLYSAGAPTWALAGGQTFGATTTQTFTTTWTTHWQALGAGPGGAAALLALPGASLGQPATLLAAGSAGLATSADGGAHWSAVSGMTAALQSLAAGASAFWAAGAGGLFTAPAPPGPWKAVPLAEFGGLSGVATADTGGADVFAAVKGAGLLLSTDGGQSWSGAGCAGGTISALAGTFNRTAPSTTPSPLLYVGDVAGHVAALSAAGGTAP